MRTVAAYIEHATIHIGDATCLMEDEIMCTEAATYHMENATVH